AVQQGDRDREHQLPGQVLRIAAARFGAGVSTSGAAGHWRPTGNPACSALAVHSRKTRIAASRLGGSICADPGSPSHVQVVLVGRSPATDLRLTDRPNAAT